MAVYTYCALCHFGLEAVLKREITDLGYTVTRSEDGRIFFRGDAAACARTNINLRSAERVLLVIGEFTASSFDELYEETRALPFEIYLPRDARFWVTKASSVRSALFSPSDIQRIMKKAAADRMGDAYGLVRMPENGADYPLRVSIRNDTVTVGLDTTGISLHKRGYRVSPTIAPISETLAAALILLTPFRSGRIFVDPFCGSGTFPIEAAMIAADIAPGLGRGFLSEKWKTVVSPDEFKKERARAKEKIRKDRAADIQGYDIDGSAVRHARDNAKAAGVAESIHFQQRAVKDLRHPGSYGFIVTNPPYGERLKEEEEVAIERLYEELGEAFRRLPTWSMYLITSFEGAQKAIGRNADKNRKIYNGMLRTYFYSYNGPKPPKKERSENK